MTIWEGEIKELDKLYESFQGYLPDIVKEALEQPEKSPRELAFHITDTRKWFISESSV